MELKLDNIVKIRSNKTIYRDGDKIIKLFNEDHPKSVILNEALNQSRVEENTNLNVPKLLEVSKIDNRWALVLENVEGKTIAELMEEDPANKNEYMRLFVEVQLVVLDNQVPMLSRIKDKFEKKLEDATNIDENTKYELMQRLQGMKNHDELCHGDYHPSNVIVKSDGSIYIIDWAHVTQGNAAADAARTFLLFSIDNEEELAEQYLDLFCEKSKIPRSTIQRWIPIVAATQMTKQIPEEQEFLSKWINVVDYQ